MKRITLNCPKCGRFSKTAIKKDIRNQWRLIFHCEKCNIEYGRAVGYTMDVDGEMQCYISEIMKNSKTWVDLKKVIK